MEVLQTLSGLNNVYLSIQPFQGWHSQNFFHPYVSHKANHIQARWAYLYDIDF